MCPTNSPDRLCMRPVQRMEALLLRGGGQDGPLPHMTQIICPDVAAAITSCLVANPGRIDPDNYRAALRDLGEGTLLALVLDQVGIWQALRGRGAEFLAAVARILRAGIGEILWCAYRTGALREGTVALWEWSAEASGWHRDMETLARWVEYHLWGLGNPDPQPAQLGADTGPAAQPRGPPANNVNPSDSRFPPREPPLATPRPDQTRAGGNNDYDPFSTPESPLNRRSRPAPPPLAPLNNPRAAAAERARRQNENNGNHVNTGGILPPPSYRTARTAQTGRADMLPGADTTNISSYQSIAARKVHAHIRKGQIWIERQKNLASAEGTQAEASRGFLRAEAAFTDEDGL